MKKLIISFLPIYNNLWGGLMLSLALLINLNYLFAQELTQTIRGQIKDQHSNSKWILWIICTNPG